MKSLQSFSTLPRGIFWSTPLAQDSDFTAEDPLALDYLGQQVGLWLFRGFTTRTSRAQNYAVVLYGLHLADRAIPEYGYSGDDQTRTKLFERWERFWALATVEGRSGQLIRGDEDAMRGVRGAARAWFPGNKSLPLDFPLISRQNELGGLGAYLTSLREYGLVFPGSLRVTPAASEIIDAFWCEPSKGDWRARYEEYALQALDFERKAIPRSHGHLKLARLGWESSLSALVNRERTKQQDRLWNALFLAARDGSTLLLARTLMAANSDGINEPEDLLEGMVGGRWSQLPFELMDRVQIALAFGRLARALLTCFNRAYGYVDQHGWVADVDAVAAAAFPEDEVRELNALCGGVLSAVGARRFRQLQYHGPVFITLLNQLASSRGIDSLNHLLTFHRRVQISRRGGGAWIREEQGKLVMQVPGYNGYKSDVGFPGFKLSAVRQLLTDLGRLS